MDQDVGLTRSMRVTWQACSEWMHCYFVL